ncbi:MAG: hypothetical protein SPJ13_06545 [Bacteroidales bacterium]|nr:hypothetical protein [Bacteroidales bacterium]
MKKFSIIMVLVATVVLGGCKSGGFSSNSAAVAQGTACGSALKTLNNSYKSTGKVDLGNTANLGAALTLATAYSQLKANKDNANYKTSFANGMVTGGVGLLTPANATNVMNALLNSTGITQENIQNAQSKVQTAAAIVNILRACN